MKLNHDRVIMVANWQYCLAGKEIHMRVTEKLVKNPEEEGVTLAYNCSIVAVTLLFGVSGKSKAFRNESKTIGEKAERSGIYVKAD